MSENKKVSELTEQALESDTEFYIQRNNVSGKTTLSDIAANHSQSIDTVNDSATYVRMTPSERSKLSNIEAGASAYNLPIGTILPYAGDVAPDASYLICNGGEISQTTYATLYSLIGNTYGEASQGKFKLPDLQGRIPMGAGSGSGLTVRARGDQLGEEAHQLTIDEMPSHTHGGYVTQSGQTQTGEDDYQGNFVNPYGQTEATGGDGAHNNIQPCTVINYIIKVL